MAVFRVALLACTLPSVVATSGSSGSCDADSADCDENALLQHQHTAAMIKKHQQTTCAVNATVNCFADGTGGQCRGDQCCSRTEGGPTYTCPSASAHYSGCNNGKDYDCTGGSPSPTPAPTCDTSRCNGCSGEQCNTCRQEAQVNCCRHNCAAQGLSDDALDYCRSHCCNGRPAATSCSTPAPTPAPCDKSGCQGCSGEQCTICYQDAEFNCCVHDSCHGCSGEQCTYCHAHCCRSHPAASSCSAPTPTPPPSLPATCTVGESVACSQIGSVRGGAECAGDQCCPDGHTCPSASVSHVTGCSMGKAYDCTR